MTRRHPKDKRKRKELIRKASQKMQRSKRT
jgi:hypothetical protein